MTTADFLEQVAAILQVDPADVRPSAELAALGPWDSLAQLSVIALAMDGLATTPDPQRLADCRTVADLIEMFKDRLR